MNRARALVHAASAKGLRLSTAESCTGGLIAAAITDIAGSSAIFDQGFVTYANAAKHQTLGVSETDLAHHGAVSAPVAQAMAEGALRVAKADIAVSVTGIAGPDGGSPDKPVGLVWFGLAQTGQPTATHKQIFPDTGRDGIRQAARNFALGLLAQAVSER